MNDSPREMLGRGVAILAPAFEPHGFVYAPSGLGTSSDGTLASGRFARGERHLSLHHRWALGIVAFGIDQLIVPYEDYFLFLGVADRSTLLWTRRLRLTHVEGKWAYTFTDESIRRFYLWDVLVHAIGHHVDRSHPDRTTKRSERFAEWFARTYEFEAEPSNALESRNRAF